MTAETVSSGPAPHRCSIRVYYEDTDAGGIVYYANYLKFAERARTEILRAMGQDHVSLAARDGVGFVVRRCVAEYRQPARLDDLLTVETQVVSIGGARFEMTQRVLRNDTILCDLAVTLGCVDGNGRPARLPAAVRGALAAVAPAGHPHDRGREG
jgi:acyl-CoA thioester hydrolase